MELKTQFISTAFFTEQAGTRIAWLGMAGALIQARGTTLLIDPLISMIERDGAWVNEEGYRQKVPLPVEAKDIPRADLVMYTHADGDHFGQVTARTLAERTDCRFLAPPPVAQGLRALGVSPERIRIAKERDVLRVGAAEIQVTPAMHDWQEVNPWRREDCCGCLVKTPDGTVWHPGDTRLIDDLLKIKDVDVMFFDVAAVISHLGPEGSARLGKSCGAKVMIAYHYGTFDMEPGSYGNCDPQDALPYLADVPGRFLILNPGEILELPVG